MYMCNLSQIYIFVLLILPQNITEDSSSLTEWMLFCVSVVCNNSILQVRFVDCILI
jgi:hypothetical protein